MRLPSYTTQDQKEMIRTLAAPHISEGEIVMDAEEYLQPRESASNSRMEFSDGCSSLGSGPLPNSGATSLSAATEAALANHRNLARHHQNKHFPAYPASAMSNRHSAYVGSGSGMGPPDYKSVMGASHQHLPGVPGRIRPDPAPSSHFGSMVGIPVQDSMGPNFLSMPRYLNLVQLKIVQDRNLMQIKF
jgi:hypothetical protein